jgi:hypothetical protein
MHSCDILEYPFLCAHTSVLALIYHFTRFSWEGCKF